MATAALFLAIAALVAWLPRRLSEPGSDAPAANEDTSINWRDLRAISPLTALPMAFAVACSGVAALSFGIEIPPLLTASGFSGGFAATALGLSAAGGMLGNLAAGWLLDHHPARLTTLGVGLAVSCGLAAFALLAAHPLAWLAVSGSLLFGVGLGASEILWITLTKRQFGTALFALTYGGWSFAYSLGYALAGTTGGTAYELLSRNGYLAFSGALCLPTLVFATWRPGARNDEPADDALLAAAR